MVFRDSRSSSVSRAALALRGSKRLRAVGAALGFVLLSLLGAAFVVSVFGARTYHWRAFDIRVSVQPALRGQTRLDFAPIGEVRARTHATPLTVTIRLASIDFERMKQLVLKPPPRAELEKEFAGAARRSLINLALWQITLGAAGALLVPLFLRLRRARWWALAAACGAGFTALVFVGTLQTFDRKAFQSPTYTGSLREARWMIGFVTEAVGRAEALSDKLRNVANNLGTLYGRIGAIPGLVQETETVKILHISDIHNNPAAVPFVRELAEKMKVDAILDTGDLTDFGTPLETRLSRGLAPGSIPYIFVAGNHDSQATVRAVRARPNTFILDGEPVTVAGLTFLGLPDPSSARAGNGSVNTSLEALEDAGDRMAARYAAAMPPPDVVCVHNPRQAAPLLGLARVVLCGHMHRASIETTDGTVICNAGTTGAAGARYFDRAEGVPFSAALLTFTRSPEKRLLFIDLVVLDGSLGQYSIRRTSFPAEEEPPFGTEN